jgi:hypothetical protein
MKGRSVLLLVVVSVSLVGVAFVVDACHANHVAQHMEDIREMHRLGYSQGLAEGLKLAPRTASAPEIGALVLCREALAEAEARALRAANMNRTCDARVQNAHDQGANTWYRLGREDWRARPFDCPKTVGW